MGEIFQAECGCGYRSGVLAVGCGMADMNRYNVPVACPVCHSVRVVELQHSPRRCRKCKMEVYYLHEAGNFAPADVARVFRVPYPWELDSTTVAVDERPAVRYRCPKCWQMTLRLESCGCWD